MFLYSVLDLWKIVPNPNLTHNFQVQVIIKRSCKSGCGKRVSKDWLSRLKGLVEHNIS